MSEAIDRGTELMEFVAKALVSNPDDVKVEVSDDGRTLELNTADDDRGRVILGNHAVLENGVPGRGLRVRDGELDRRHAELTTELSVVNPELGAGVSDDDQVGIGLELVL